MERFSPFIMLLFFISCDEKPKVEEIRSQFTFIPKSVSGISFANMVKEDDFNNLISNFYIYNGAGVAVGDINNDGLDDIYFVSNQNEDKLYLNKGDFKFDDITLTANINNADGWSTGVSMVDINSDGWLDIFVCKSSPAKTKDVLQNKIYVNNKDNTFKESSNDLGLGHLGFSTQTYFLDYDNDGDLDIYMLDHQMRNIVFPENVSSQVKAEYSKMSNQLFRNDNNKFVNVTISAFNDLGIYPSLSASIGDFNNDLWPDIYVCNDFLLPDQLFINNQDGTFTNEILKRTNHISSNSMGSDYADLNNDLLPDLLVLDMLAEDHVRSKENMTTMNSKLFDSVVSIGYHKQYMSNVLQLNKGNGTFSEIAQLAGINKTDWSWGPLIADFDNDGFKDIFISNGIERDIDNRDFRNTYQQYLDAKTAMSLDKFHSLIPSTKLHNYIYKNNGDYTFTDKSESWGLQHKINSNGAAYADLDNDGDLDLILNNINEQAAIYKNNSKHNFLQIKLKGSDKNRFAIGSKVYVYSNGNTQFQELYTSRGFQSSVSTTLNFGLKQDVKVDSVKVVWDSERQTIVTNIQANSFIDVKFTESGNRIIKQKENKETLLVEVSGTNNNSISHKQNYFNDYNLQLLLPFKQSVKTSALAIADINNDGLEDIFIGNASGYPSVLLEQDVNGNFIKTNEGLLDIDKKYEAINSVFFDADNDGDLDLYVANGGYEFEVNSRLLQDILYVNNGKGVFHKEVKALPKMYVNTSSVKPIDFDNDGDLDLFIAGGVLPGKYPMSDSSFFLENDKGIFKDVTSIVIKGLDEKTGFINDIVLSDFDNDGDKDLIAVGEWMPITLFINENGFFSKEKNPVLENTNGWWYTIEAIDLDNDGHEDYLLGNLGDNNKFHPTIHKPLHVYANDFDQNGTFDILLSKEYKGQLVPVRGRECSSEQNSFIKERVKSFSQFANSNIKEIYGDINIEEALHLKAYTFSSSYLKNKGNGNFELIPLPKETQFSPTLDFETIDINKDGYKDIIGIGNFYDSETETISYDAGRGYVLLNNDKGELKYLNKSGLDVNRDSKKVSLINTKNKTHLIVLNNDDDIQLFKISK